MASPLQKQLTLDASQAQRLRAQRQLLAIAASVGAILILVVLNQIDALPTRALWQTCALIGLACVLFMSLILTGTNRRFKDPSMTGLQVIGATCALLYAAFHATTLGHTVILLTIPMTFAFASFKFSIKPLAQVFFVVVSLVAIEMIFRWNFSPQTTDSFTLTAPGVVSLLVSLAVMTLTAGQINQIRESTRTERAASHLAMTRLSEAVITVDLMHQVQFANAGAQALFSVYAPQAQHMIIDDLCRFIGQPPISDVLTEITIKAALDGVATSDARNMNPRKVSGTIKTSDGVRRDVELSVSPLTTSRGALEGYVLVVRDITESRRLMNELQHAASHDLLTGLLNRRGFIDALTNALPKHEKQSSPCVIVMDMDQFKIVNDACGHHAGDELLRNVAGLMRNVAPDAKLARLGGDEFGMILQGMDTPEAEQLATRLLKDFSDMRFIRDGRSFKVGASIGIAKYTADCFDVELLLTRADSACFLAKERGRNCFQTYSLGDDEVSRHERDVSWVSRISDALENDRFILYAQKIAASSPQANSRDSFELLLRMIDENGEIVLPQAFLPSAERFNMISTLDKQVIKLAIQTLSGYASSGQSIPNVSINLSATSLRDRDLVRYISNHLNSSGLSGEFFTFELTETAAIFDIEQANRVFTNLKKLGCKVALDDVGSGFNSFYNLRQIPVDIVKIDGSYVKNVCTDDMDRIFIESIQRIADLLQLETVAEYVESDQIRAAVKDIGIDYLQGYDVHKPEPLSAVMKRIGRSRSETSAEESQSI